MKSAGSKNDKCKNKTPYIITIEKLKKKKVNLRNQSPCPTQEKVQQEVEMQK